MRRAQAAGCAVGPAPRKSAHSIGAMTGFVTPPGGGAVLNVPGGHIIAGGLVGPLNLASP
jgi:hypothetical protein